MFDSYGKAMKKPIAKSCLVADDDRVSREILQAYMEDKGFMVHTANDGGEALLLCNHQDYDCIFVDWEMPGTNGLEFMKQYNKLSKGRAICIMYSVRDRACDINEAHHLGIKNYFVKPLKRSELDIKLKEIGVFS